MTGRALARGAVVVDVAALALGAEDRERLLQPSVGGVILFARNYESPAQLTALCASIRALRAPALVICVDHEGGRVQRFRDGFTQVAPMRELGRQWDVDVAAAAVAATRTGHVIASELRAQGVDFSFTPVLDVDFGRSTVIGDRALHRNPNAIAALAKCLIDGLHAGGAACVGKHFPGHGFVAADSHTDLPVDDREMAELVAVDLVPFAALARNGLDAVMPAHVIYAKIDSELAGFSSYWLRDRLRGRYGFDGMIFSDDLSMAGAARAGDVVARAAAAADAGCDVVLVCNDSINADRLLEHWRPPANARLASRWETMQGRPTGRCPV
ncbi:MAG: beta-N-acetylhexosaminidase [Betaproteobacteria bacterium]